MDRKGQNLEFSQKMSTKSEECLERRSHHLFSITRPQSGGDIANNPDTTIHCNSKNPSYQSIHAYKSKQTVEQFEDAEQSEDSRLLKSTQSELSSSLEIKRNGSQLSKRKPSNKYSEAGAKLKAELSKYKKELKEYNNTTKDLEEKYIKINFELNEMQQKHDRFVANRKCTSNASEGYSDSSSSSSAGSEFSLKRKYTQVFHRGSSFMTMLPPQNASRDHVPMVYDIPTPTVDSEVPLLSKKRKNPPAEYRHCSQAPQPRRTVKRKPENKENDPPPNYNGLNQSPALKDIYRVLKNVLDTNQKTQNLKVKGNDFKELQSTINSLQSEQAQFRNIIQQQQSCLQDYHTRCIKAQQIMQTQQLEIEKLNSNNQQLESEINLGIDQLRVKIDSKLKDVSQLPQIVRDEQSKYDKVTKENTALNDRLRLLQTEASQLKMKIEELGRRKVMTVNRLKATERDLKIFKNYNIALKHEKRKLSDELQNMKEQLETVNNSSKRALARQREQNEKQRRDLQKRVFELELKLSRSQNSTSDLIQERDSLIAELQTQLNTLVHNFEVSQKHIRVLRRHIYSMSGGNVRANNRLLTEAV